MHGSAYSGMLYGHGYRGFQGATISDQGVVSGIRVEDLIGLDSLSVACCTKRVKRCVMLHCDITSVTHVPGIVACHLNGVFTVSIEILSFMA